MALRLQPPSAPASRFRALLGVALALCWGFTGAAADAGQRVPNAAARAAAGLHAIERLPGSQRLELAISLPLRNQGALEDFLRQLQDPSSPNYHRYLTPAQFTERFGPAPADYEAVAAFAQAHHLAVTGKHPNRLVLDVAGRVADVEAAMHVTMRVYAHPAEARHFYAPDAEPTLDTAVPILQISGLDNFSIPRPRLKLNPPPPYTRQNAVGAEAAPNGGSGPGGTLMGDDFRAAYVPGVSVTGSGQVVGLLQFDGYTPADIAYYESATGRPAVPLTNVLLDNFDGTPTGTGGEVEVSLDIEMVISMSPGVSGFIVYEAGPYGNWHDILNRMATDNLARELSCSWYLPNGAKDPTADAIFQEMAAQGQSFFSASGDSDAFTGLIPFPGDSPYITQVGGTQLTVATSGTGYGSEAAWNRNNGVGTGGGISTQYTIPPWQQGISMTANQGSATMRNVPDVALTAENVYVRADGEDQSVGGTSCAAPLWAAFTALVNQEATALGRPPAGFVNPAVYAVGEGNSYGADFHDITTGNNFNSASPAKFSAVAGYDLCTGWGTPTGLAAINALAGTATPQIITGTASLPLAVAGVPFSQSFTALGGAPPYTWSWPAGALPPGLTLASGGMLSGTPAVSGTYAFGLEAADSAGATSGTAWYTLVVLPAGSPVITTAGALASGTVGYAYAQGFAAFNGAVPYSWAVAGGTLPAGLSLGASTGLVTGTPSATGSSAFVVQVTGTDGLAYSAPFSLVIRPAPTPPAITTPGPLTPGAVGAPYYIGLSVSPGTPPYSWALAGGSLPGGLSLSSGGLISGLPQAAGTSAFSVQVTDSNGLTATAAFTLPVAPQGTLLNGSFETGGFTSWVTSDIGTPLVPVQVHTNGYSPGYGLFNCVATDGSCSAIGSFGGAGSGTVQIAQDIEVSAALRLLAFDYRVGWDMQNYGGSTQARTLTVTIQPGGGGATLSGTTLVVAPAGSMQLDSGPGTGYVDLTPYIGQSIRVCFNAVIPEANTGPGYFEIDNARTLAALPLVITTPGTLATGTSDSPYSQGLAAAGAVSAYTWAIASGSLPPGLAMSATGVIAGIPTVYGTFAFSAQVTAGDGSQASRAFTLGVSRARLLYFPLNTDPGWTRSGQWAFGPPQGHGGTQHGYPDPVAAATGTNVFGVNLNGDYSTSVGGPYYLTAGPLNFSQYTGTVLQFQRWLNTDYQPYVVASIQVSANGTSWTNVFANSSTTPVTDSTWMPVSYDISAVADMQPAVYIRWGYSVKPYAYAYSGWNIDDVAILGAGPAAAPAVPGGLAATGTAATAFSYQVPASNDANAFTASGLPAGLAMNASTGLISGTPGSPGAFRVLITEGNMLGSGSGTMLINVSASFRGWQEAWFTPAQAANTALSGPVATPAGDGVPNLLKYALNLNPLANASGMLPVAAFQAINGATYLTLSYNELISASDITYVPEVSADLKTWNSGAGYIGTVSVTPNGDGISETVVVQSLTPVGSAACQCMRLRVTSP